MDEKGIAPQEPSGEAGAKGARSAAFENISPLTNGRMRMDNYQPVYDAVSSAFSLADHTVKVCFQEVCISMTRPSVLFRPAISIDGNKWCALYGANLQDGVAGFGDTPEAAMLEFDKAWIAPLRHADRSGKGARS